MHVCWLVCVCVDLHLMCAASHHSYRRHCDSRERTSKVDKVCYSRYLHKDVAQRCCSLCKFVYYHQFFLHPFFGCIWLWLECWILIDWIVVAEISRNPFAAAFLQSFILYVTVVRYIIIVPPSQIHLNLLHMLNTSSAAHTHTHFSVFFYIPSKRDHSQSKRIVPLVYLRMHNSFKSMQMLSFFISMQFYTTHTRTHTHVCIQNACFAGKR